jgi:TRAP-type C4-dicarboxylate transport system permease small subunit
MPKLIRLYVTSTLAGFALALAFVAMLLALDVANLRHLVLGTQTGWLGGLLLVVFNGIVFAGVQFGIAIMRMAEPGSDAPHGGLHQPVLIPIRVERRRP